MAKSNGTTYQIIPGKFNPSNPRALIVDLVTGARHPVRVTVWAQNQAFLEATDNDGNVLHFHANTALDIYRGITALVNWSHHESNSKETRDGPAKD